jgi:hypothetical protein
VKQIKLLNTLMFFLFTTVPPAAFAQKNGGMTIATSTLTISGKSSGGMLTVMRVPAWNCPYVIVTNMPGDSASTVIARLSKALSDCAACSKYYGGMVYHTNNNLVLIGYGWIFGGTDNGFNIPKAPTAFTASCQSNILTLKWNNEAEYDSIELFIDGIRVATLPGSATQYTLDNHNTYHSLFLSRLRDVTFSICVVKSGTPSNGSVLRLKNRTLEELLLNTPFLAGVAPGFEKWTDHKNHYLIDFEQGSLPEMMPATDVRWLEGKGFYQMLGCQGASRGGVARRFIGLNPEHTYRVSARLNVLEAPKDNWTFSMHAAANPPGGARLSAEQVAGQSDLPNASKGSSAGQIVRLDSNHQARGQWENHSSSETSSDNVAKDITLPAGADSLTVWFRLEGSTSGKTSVGIDSVTIEDLGIKQ